MQGLIPFRWRPPMLRLYSTGMEPLDPIFAAAAPPPPPHLQFVPMIA